MAEGPLSRLSLQWGAGVSVQGVRTGSGPAAVLGSICLNCCTPAQDSLYPSTDAAGNYACIEGEENAFLLF